MIKYKLLFTVDISATDKGEPPLGDVAFCAHKQQIIITTKNKNRARIKNKINTLFSTPYFVCNFDSNSAVTIVIFVIERRHDVYRLRLISKDELFDIELSMKNQFHTVNKFQPNTLHREMV